MAAKPALEALYLGLKVSDVNLLALRQKELLPVLQTLL